MTEIVGILNITPDSFSDGGKYDEVEKALRRVEEIFEEGADSIDIGAESTRPGATTLAVEEEWSRLEPLLEKLQQTYPAHLFSIDTRHMEIVARSVDLWSPEITINDMTGLTDNRIVETVAAQGLRVIIGHLPNTAAGKIARAHREIKMTSEWDVRDQLICSYLRVIGRGVKPENIILDPGIGFGKTPALNRKLLGFAALVPTVPVMIGYSRKRFLGQGRKGAIANVAAGQEAVRAGAAFLRVHDVAAHYEMLHSVEHNAA